MVSVCSKRSTSTSASSLVGRRTYSSAPLSRISWKENLPSAPRCSSFQLAWTWVTCRTLMACRVCSCDSATYHLPFRFCASCGPLSPKGKVAGDQDPALRVEDQVLALRQEFADHLCVLRHGEYDVLRGAVVQNQLERERARSAALLFVPVGVGLRHLPDLDGLPGLFLRFRHLSPPVSLADLRRA